MKILNLYCGIGGNRKLWGEDHEITAVEFNPQIAAIYQDFFPNDKMVIGDAHQYLLDHYKEFDFIWASPPCPTHSDIRRCGVHAGQYEAQYPDMKLYEEIILLMNFAPKETKWVVENVKPYYTPLIPAKELERHLFWTNFEITPRKMPKNNKIPLGEMHTTKKYFGFDLNSYKIESSKRTKILRNMVNPEIGLYLLNEAQDKKTDIFEQPNLL